MGKVPQSDQRGRMSLQHVRRSGANHLMRNVSLSSLNLTNPKLTQHLPVVFILPVLEVCQRECLLHLLFIIAMALLCCLAGVAPQLHSKRGLVTQDPMHLTISSSCPTSLLDVL